MSPLRGYESALRYRAAAREAVAACEALDAVEGRVATIGDAFTYGLVQGLLYAADAMVRRARVRLALAGVAWLILASVVIVIVWALIILFTAAAPDAPPASPITA